MLKKLILLSLILFTVNCAKTTQVAGGVEKNIHTYLGAFRTEFRARCSDSNLLSSPCETVRKSWINVLEVAINYDEALLSGKVNAETVNSFRISITNLINTVSNTEFSDLKPNLNSLLELLK